MKNLRILTLLLMVASCAIIRNDNKVEDDYYTSNIERFMQNVSVKEENPRYVIYEYKDVRIDEVASIATRYCAEHGDKKAFLRQSITYRNHLRRATFDCVNLQ